METLIISRCSWFWKAPKQCLQSLYWSPVLPHMSNVCSGWSIFRSWGLTLMMSSEPNNRPQLEQRSSCSAFKSDFWNSSTQLRRVFEVGVTGNLSLWWHCALYSTHDISIAFWIHCDIECFSVFDGSSTSSFFKSRPLRLCDRLFRLSWAPSRKEILDLRGRVGSFEDTAWGVLTAVALFLLLEPNSKELWNGLKTVCDVAKLVLDGNGSLECISDEAFASLEAFGQGVLCHWIPDASVLGTAWT